MTEDEAIAAARKQYADGSDDDIEIDERPKASKTEGGYWVEAWVYVREPDTTS